MVTTLIALASYEKEAPMQASLSKRLFTGVMVLAALIGIVYIYFMGASLSLPTLQHYQAALKALVRNHYILALGAFALIYIIAVNCAIPAAPLTMLGGFLFDLIPGFIIVLISATVAGCLGFLLVRQGLGHRFQHTYSKRLENFNAEIAQNGVYYLITLRFSFFIPFFLINVLAGLTKMPLRSFALTTLIGMIPATMMYTYAGQQFQTFRHIYDIFNWQLGGAFLLFALLALTPVLFKRWKKARL